MLLYVWLISIKTFNGRHSLQKGVLIFLVVGLFVKGNGNYEAKEYLANELNLSMLERPKYDNSLVLTEYKLCTISAAFIIKQYTLWKIYLKWKERKDKNDRFSKTN